MEGRVGCSVVGRVEGRGQGAGGRGKVEGSTIGQQEAGWKEKGGRLGGRGQVIWPNPQHNLNVADNMAKMAVGEGVNHAGYPRQGQRRGSRGVPQPSLLPQRGR